jgi:hypothetical protein
MTMLQHQIGLLQPLLTSCVLMTVLVLYVHYTTDRHYRIKLLLGPALLVACVLTVPAVGARLGYAWPASLPQSFEYMAHKTVLDGIEKRWIDVLLQSREPLEADSRLHRIPWSEKMESLLEQAQRMRESLEGGDILVTLQGSGTGSADDYPEYVPRRVLPRDAHPKSPPQPPVVPDSDLRESPFKPPTGPRLSV